MKRITKRDVQERIDRFNNEIDGLKLRLYVYSGHKSLVFVRPNGSINMGYGYTTYAEVLQAIALLSDYIVMSKGEGLTL